MLKTCLRLAAMCLMGGWTP